MLSSISVPKTSPLQIVPTAAFSESDTRHTPRVAGTALQGRTLWLMIAHGLQARSSCATRIFTIMAVG